MAGNLVIVCRDQDADAFYELMQEYGSFQTRLSSTAWYLNMNVVPESLQEEILSASAGTRPSTSSRPRP